MRTSQHSSTRFRIATLAAAVALSACNCDRPLNTGGTHPDIVANPVALSFNACPTQDENGAPVADVFPDKQTFHLQNLGKSSATLTYEIRGPAKDQFTIVPETKVDALADGAEADITVQFTPIKAGDVWAELVVDDGDEETPQTVITLVGSGSSLPAQPTLKISFETAPGSGEMTDCREDVNGQISNCLIQWPDTFLDQTSSLNLKLQNLGCPALKVTELSVEPFQAGGPAPQFVLEEPAVPPTQDAPMLLSMADGTQSTNVRIRFEPKDDGSGDGQRYAIVNVKTNSPKSPSQLTLFGYAAQPAIYLTPTYCDFTDPNDSCNGTKVPTTGTNKKAVFQVVNGGNSNVTITSVDIRAPNSGRFTIGAQNPTGKTIAPGASEPLEIDYTDAPVYVTDLLDVKATSNGNPTNVATARLSGGVLPCLEVTPAQQLDFSDATTNPSTKQIQICNCPTGGTLNIKRVQVVQSALFFAVKTPPAKTALAAGECTTADIQFTKPNTGGLQTGTLEIETNDPNYAAPSYYRLNLYSQVPLNQIPVAVLKGPHGQTNAFSADLSTLNPKKLLLDASSSYDPPGMSTPATNFTYWVTKKPTGAQGVILETIANPGVNVDGKKITEDKVVLVLDPNKTGEYQVTLVVEDATGQKSAADVLKILINP